MVLAGIFLILVSLVGVVVGVLPILGGSMFSSLGDFSAGVVPTDQSNAVRDAFNTAGGFFIAVGVIWIVISAVQLLTGIGVLAHSTFARILGFLYALPAAVLWTFLFITTFGGSYDGKAVAIVVTGVLFVGYWFTLYALARGGAHFRPR